MVFDDGQKVSWTTMKIFSAICSVIITIIAINVVVLLFEKYSLFPSNIIEYADQEWKAPNTDRKIYVSYALYAPIDQNNDKSHKICLDNVDMFVKRGVDYHPNVQFIFNLIGNTRTPYAIEAATKRFKNVKVTHTEFFLVDLFAHGKVLRSYFDNSPQESDDVFIFLNCGARGPYFSHALEGNASSKFAPRLRWVSKFLSKLTFDVHGVASTVSCEIHAHLQTYSFALDQVSAKLAMRLWSPRPHVTDKLQIVRDAEIGVSEVMMESGLKFVSLDSRYRHINFLHKNVTCEPDYRNLRNENYINPTRCDSGVVIKKGKQVRVEAKTPGCEGLEPCEVVFVKYGGEVYQKNMIASTTEMRVREEDKAYRTSQGMCSRPVVKRRPLVDTAAIYFNVSKKTWRFSKGSEMVVMIRAHAGYVNQLVSFLWSLEAAQSHLAQQIVVLVIPTDYPSVELLQRSLKTEWFSTSIKDVQVIFLDFPAWIYEEYGHELDTLCATPYRQMLMTKHKELEVRRHCGVNSPLHYLLVDVALHHVLHRCRACKQLLVTNADNHYSKDFLNFTIDLMYNSTSNAVLHDVVMTYMVTKGNLIHSRAKRGNADLGCFIVNVNFLKHTHVTFLNSLPYRSQASDYHDADGYFIGKLRRSGAVIYVYKAFFFFHD